MVTASSIRAGAFAALYALINTNKVSGSTILASYPERSPSFPCVIMPMPEAEVPESLTLSEVRQHTFTIEFSVWVTASQGQAKVAELLDNLQSTLESNTSTLTGHKIKFESFSPSRVDKVEVNEQKLYTAGGIASFSTFNI
jgi:hypothetical protein